MIQLTNESVFIWAYAWPFIKNAAVARPFGSIQGHGDLTSLAIAAFQHREHERITRAALGCNGKPSDGNCFEPKTLDLLAGYYIPDLPDIFSLVTLGAVGAPDLNEVYIAAAHCDNADYLNVPNYPQTRFEATEALYSCLGHFADRFHSGAGFSSSLIAGTAVSAPENDISKGCSFTYASSLIPQGLSLPELLLTLAGDFFDLSAKAEKAAICFGLDFASSTACAGPPSAGNAKCNVLRSFGAVLHGTQDFFAHSNWGNVADNQALGLQNPSGLDQTDLPTFLDFRTGPGELFVSILQDLPSDFTTECFTSPDHAIGAGVCENRVTHFTMNKDEGEIYKDTDGVWKGRSPATPRGKIGSNFGRFR